MTTSFHGGLILALSDSVRQMSNNVWVVGEDINKEIPDQGLIRLIQGTQDLHSAASMEENFDDVCSNPERPLHCTVALVAGHLAVWNVALSDAFRIDAQSLVFEDRG
mmetsp:Transcript_2216/g.5157  ORF Transcript_2216/g.5157 Transcript_2216/m.5157 type:complete len:107 (+) Transcript_2216:49-369(+)